MELARTCPAPKELETGTITGGFAHAAVDSVVPAVVEAVKNGTFPDEAVHGY